MQLNSLVEGALVKYNLEAATYGALLEDALFALVYKTDGQRRISQVEYFWKLWIRCLSTTPALWKLHMQDSFAR